MQNDTIRAPRSLAHRSAASSSGAGGWAPRPGITTVSAWDSADAVGDLGPQRTDPEGGRVRSAELVPVPGDVEHLLPRLPEDVVRDSEADRAHSVGKQACHAMPPVCHDPILAPGPDLSTSVFLRATAFKPLAPGGRARQARTAGTTAGQTGTGDADEH